MKRQAKIARRRMTTAIIGVASQTRGCLKLDAPIEYKCIFDPHILRFLTFYACPALKTDELQEAE